MEYHHYSAVKIKPEIKANIYRNNNNKLTPVKIREKKINNKRFDLNYNCEIKKNVPVLIYSDSQKIITNDNNKKYRQNYLSNPIGSIFALKKFYIEIFPLSFLF